MAPRSNRKGYLKLSLVSARIAIYPATSVGEKVRHDLLGQGTGDRLKRRTVDAVTSEYAYGESEDDESASIQIDIELFATKASVDDRYRDTPFYLAPEDEVGQEAFAVIRDAMRNKKAVGVARVVMASRERFMMLEPFGKGIIGTLLHHPHDVRSKAVLEEIHDLNLPDQMIGLAEDIIDRMSGEFAPEKFRYGHEPVTIEFIQDISADPPAAKEKLAPSTNDGSLINMLTRSIEVVQRTRRAPPRPKVREPANQKRKMVLE
jgi:DNA end-binding protein Ku